MSKGGYLGLGEKWWRNMPKQYRNRPSTRDFLFDVPEWLYDDTERDDEEFKLNIVELISELKERTPARDIIPDKGLYDIVGNFWDTLDLSTIFRINQSIEFVQSMSAPEMKAAHESLAAIRQMIQRWIDVVGGTVDRVSSVLIQVRLMQGLIGPFVAMSLILHNRKRSDLPFSESISTIHRFVMSVKLEDISPQSDGTFRFSQRVNSEWQTVKENLGRLWKVEPEHSPT